MIQHERINKQIRASELQVIGPNGENLGIFSFDKALALAQEKELDLVEIGPKATPPVAKILEYGKFLYDKRKKEQSSKQKTHITEVKAIQITIGTGEHDLELKAKNASKWLHEGHRVKVDLFLRGRAKYLDPKFHQERLKRLLNFITEPYKIVDDAKKSHKGLSILIERDRTVKKMNVIPML